MTGMFIEAVQYFSEGGNAFGMTGIMDKHGNIIGIVLAVFGVIMLSAALKVRKMGSFYLEMDNHETVIKENGFEPATADVGEKRSTEIAGKTFSEVQLVFKHNGETYTKWTPDLGIADWVNIEYNPDDPSEFYIVDKVEEPDAAPDTDEDGEEVEELKEPPNKAFYGMLALGIVLLGLGCGFLYDFYIIK